MSDKFVKVHDSLKQKVKEVEQEYNVVIYSASYVKGCEKLMIEVAEKAGVE